MYKKIISTLLFFILSSAALAAVNFNLPWHYLQQVSTNDTGTLSVDANDNGIIDLAENVVFSIWSTSGSDIYYNGGNVGIGTSTTTGKLNIEGGPILFQNYVTHPITGNPMMQGNLRVQQSDPSDQVDYDSELILSFSGTGDLDRSSIYIGPDSAAGTQGRIQLNARKITMNTPGGSGNVGIGTHDPTEKLHVVGNIAVTGKVDGVDLSDYSPYFIDSAGTSGYVWKSDGSGRGDWAVDATGSSVWSTGAGGIVYYNGGNVGIGTSTPSAKLHVNDGYIRVTQPTSGEHGLLLETTAATVHNAPGLLWHATNAPSLPWFQIHYKGDGNGQLKFESGITTSPMTELMVIDATTGNVGIGDSSPQAKLDVNGNIRAKALCDETGANCKTLSTGWNMQCAIVRRTEDPDVATTIVSYVGPNPGTVGTIVTDDDSETIGGYNLYGFNCRYANGWAMTGCAHAGDAGDSDSFMKDNGCYAENDDGTAGSNYLDMTCCRMIT